ncbi:MAG: hypothetical protein Athens071426_62 [Parcubacteria group bacterium Athens0714_26]|nr:MAG: hypothetical protein Athens101426_244 [Parcubacteria group bacterium Athens1014_26]TSD03729.1 MAG: hypothetical protein Athens071426_62 [Parcubacteria group bacterium Athens0714_26]
MGKFSDTLKRNGGKILKFILLILLLIMNYVIWNRWIKSESITQQIKTPQTKTVIDDTNAPVKQKSEKEGKHEKTDSDFDIVMHITIDSR